MNLKIRKVGLIIAVASCLSLLATTTILAAPSDERFYIRFGAAEQTISGAFDENTSLSFKDSSTISLVTPDTKAAQGYGLTFGSQTGHVCGEISYYRTEHSSSINTSSIAALYNMGETTSERFSYDVKMIFFDPSKVVITPYMLIGGSYDTLEVKNGAIKGANNGEAKYWGVGYKLGAGVLIRLNENLGLEGSYTRSWTNLKHLKAFGAESSQEVKMETKLLAVSLNYYF